MRSQEFTATGALPGLCLPTVAGKTVFLVSAILRDAMGNNDAQGNNPNAEQGTSSMSSFERGNRLITLIVVLLGLALTPAAFAGDKEDVMAVVKKYADLESDLAEQAKLIRSDRVMITNVRQSDQAKNLEIQLASRKANEAMAGGKVKFITTLESPQVALYGNVAVASFMRMFSVYPHEQEPVQTDPTWVTLVLVKDGRSWGIAHTHVSTITAN